MHWFSALIVILSCLLTLCQTQSYRYPAQRRAGYSYSQPSSSSSYYNQPKNYYSSSSTNRYTPAKSSSSSYYNSLSNPAYTNSYTKQSSSSRNSYPYSSSAAAYTTKATTRPYYAQSSASTNSVKRNYQATPSKGYYSNSLTSSSPATNSYSKGSYNALSDNSNTKQYLSNSYTAENYKKDTTTSSDSTATTKNKNRVSKADAENAKFAGADNQENEEDGRTAHLKRRKFHRRFGGGILGNPCSPFGRDASNGVTPPPKEQGRILWDVNVYNVYPQTSVGLGCGGYGGGLGGGLGAGLGGGLLSDPIAPAYYPPGAGISNFLSLFAPGILQNSLAVTARPPQYADYAQSSNVNNDLQNDPEVDPNYRPGGGALPNRRPNRVFYDSVGAPPITPGQLVGGIATTVNGIIQQLTGNVQPVYG